jgi:hypothetical protein
MTKVTTLVAIYRDCPDGVPLDEVSMKSAVRCAIANTGIKLLPERKGGPEPNLNLYVPLGSRSCEVSITVEHESGDELEPARKLIEALKLYFRPREFRLQ